MQNLKLKGWRYSAGATTYLDAVIKGGKALVMLDELAQYAARLEAARPKGPNSSPPSCWLSTVTRERRSGLVVVLLVLETVFLGGDQRYGISPSGCLATTRECELALPTRFGY